MRHALVFGGTGQVGDSVIARMHAQGWRITAVSRQPMTDEPALTWLQGGFDAMPALPAGIDAIVSCGPLDGFARWYAKSGPQAARVLAFGSTSVRVKQNSPDDEERDVAQRLQHAEDVLMERRPRVDHRRR